MSDQPPWRQSTRGEIKDYYENEFHQYIDRIPDWIRPPNPIEYAFAFRKQYPAKVKGNEVPKKDFIRRDTILDNGDVTISSWEELLDIIRKPASNDPLRTHIKSGPGNESGLIKPNNKSDEPVPAAVYYGLDNHERFWVLSFDIDAKDVAKMRIAGEGEAIDDVTIDDIEESGITQEPPKIDVLNSGKSTGDQSLMVYQYEFKDIRKSLELAFKLKSWLEETVGFDEVRVFYSGQGAHIYALDDDPYYKYTYQTRQFIAAYIIEKLQIPIDEQITWDSSRVMRVPYTLHTDVSRVMTEVTSPSYDFMADPIPNFLK